MLCAARYAGVLAALMVFPVVIGNLAAGVSGIRRHFGYELLLLLFPCITIAAASSLGVFCSLVSRSTASSMVTTYSALLALYAGPLVGNEILVRFTNISSNVGQCIGAVSPLTALVAIGRAMPDTSGDAGHLDVAALEYWPVTLAFAILLPLLLTGASTVGFALSNRGATDRG